jgi:hypothetical protein
LHYLPAGSNQSVRFPAVLGRWLHLTGKTASATYRMYGLPAFEAAEFNHTEKAFETVTNTLKSDLAAPTKPLGR